MELSCPKCGLQLAQRDLQIEYCPRCMVRRRLPVPLVAEALKSLGRRPAEGVSGPREATRAALRTEPSGASDPPRAA